jgi:hypothetical protein
MVPHLGQQHMVLPIQADADIITMGGDIDA